MRISLFTTIAVLLLVAVICGPDACADNGQNAADVYGSIKNGAATAAPSAFSGNWLGAVFGFLAGAIPGLLAVLQRQAQDKWHMFHAKNAIDAAAAQPAPTPSAVIQGPVNK